MQILKYKYRLYPTTDEISRLKQIAGSARFVWDNYLHKEMESYKVTGKFNFFKSNCRDLTQLKKTTTWLTESPAVSLQQSIRYLDQALTQSFKSAKNQKGFPKFKSRKASDCSVTLTQVSLKANIKPTTFYIPKVGNIKCIYHREIPSEFKSCQVKQVANKWFVVLTCQKQSA
jgi:putative transposase